MANMVEIKRFDILSVAKIYAVIMAIIGFVTGLFVTILSFIIGSAALLSGTASPFTAIPFAIGVFSIILLPIVYGIAGFVLGAIGAFLYNIVAERVGGVLFDLKNTRSSPGSTSHPPRKRK